MNIGLNSSELEMMRKVFAHFPQIEAVILFGSRAMLNHKPGSDVDLVLVGEVDHDTFSNIRMQLSEEIPLPYFFDVLLENEISNEALKKHVQEFGKVIYPANQPQK